MIICQQDILLEHVDMIDAPDVDNKGTAKAKQVIAFRQMLGDGNLHLVEPKGHHHVSARTGIDMCVMIIGLEIEHLWEINQIHLAIDSEEQFVGHLHLWIVFARG